MDRPLFFQEQQPPSTDFDLSVLARLAEIVDAKREIQRLFIALSNSWQLTKNEVLRLFQENEEQIISLEGFTANIVAQKKRSPIKPANFIWIPHKAQLLPNKYAVGAIDKYYDTEVVLLADVGNSEVWFAVAIDSFRPTSSDETGISRTMSEIKVIE